MLIKLQDFNDELAAHLKSATGENTAAGAVRYVANHYRANLSRIARLSDRNQALELEVKRLTSIVENARAAASALLEKTAQTDML